MKLLILICICYSSAFAQNNLNVFIAANYIANATVSKFENQYNSRIIQNYFNENDEMLAKMAAGANGYDVIFPTTYAVTQLSKMNKLQKLDLSKIPNIKNIQSSFLNPPYDPENTYSIPYAYDNVILAYNKKELSKLGLSADSWAVIFEPKYLKKLKGRVTVLNSQRHVFAAALLYLGKDPNSSNREDISLARQLIQQAMPYWAKFDSDTYYRSLVRGDIVIAMSFSVDIFKTIRDLEDSKRDVFIAAELQTEGNMYELDNIVITKDTKNLDLAYQFINNMLTTDSAVELAYETGASIMNTPALKKVSLKIKHIPWIYPGNMSKMHFLKSYNPKDRIHINEMWLELQFSCSHVCK